MPRRRHRRIYPRHEPESPESEREVYPMTTMSTNLALDLRLVGQVQAVDSQWAAEVTTYTVSKIRARIPQLPGRDDD